MKKCMETSSSTPYKCLVIYLSLMQENEILKKLNLKTAGVTNWSFGYSLLNIPYSRVITRPGFLIIVFR